MLYHNFSSLASRISSFTRRLFIDRPSNYKLLNADFFPVESEILSSLDKSCQFTLVYPGDSCLAQLVSNCSIPSSDVDSDAELFSKLLGISHFQFPRLGVIRLEEGCVAGRNGWIYAHNKYVLSDCGWYRGYENEMVSSLRPGIALAVKKLKGTVVSLCSDHCFDNYGHFLLDCLSRVHLLQSSGFCLTQADHILMPKPPGANAFELFRQAGIPLAKCVWADQQVCYEADLLYATTFPGLRRSYPGWISRYFRSLIGDVSSQPCLKLYVPRMAKNRNVVNESELQAIALSRGYQIFRPSECGSAYLMYARASHVVSAHGAALTDVVFCPASSRVLELIPSDHVFPYYFTLSIAGRLRYSCLFGKSLNHLEPGAIGPSPYDFWIDPVRFASELDFMG